MGIKCPCCGSRRTQLIEDRISHKIYFCLDCKSEIYYYPEKREKWFVLKLPIRIKARYKGIEFILEFRKEHFKDIGLLQAMLGVPLVKFLDNKVLVRKKPRVVINWKWFTADLMINNIPIARLRFFEYAKQKISQQTKQTTS